jgi:dihydrofolate reductase
MPKYVVSCTLKDPKWNNTTVLTGDPVMAAAKLRCELNGDIAVHGSAQLAQTLLEHDLVDELRLMVFPVLLGTGKRLFGQTSDKKTLRLAQTKTVGDGIVIFIHQAASNGDAGTERPHSISRTSPANLQGELIKPVSPRQ